MKNNQDFLVISGEDDIDKVSDFVRTRDYNIVHSAMSDKNGNPMVGMRSTLNNKKPENKGIILCLDKDLHQAAVRIVQANKTRKEN